MIYSSLAVLAMSASAVINPFSNLVHLHPRPAQPDTRVSVTLLNNSDRFQDVTVGGHVYTVMAHQLLSVKAPVGTVVYANTKTINHQRGAAIVELTPSVDHHQVTI